MSEEPKIGEIHKVAGVIGELRYSPANFLPCPTCSALCLTSPEECRECARIRKVVTQVIGSLSMEVVTPAQRNSIDKPGRTFKEGLLGGEWVLIPEGEAIPEETQVRYWKDGRPRP